ncbi:hypothetical protein XI03_09995 [Bradyrhizobium sp. CCBAU 65884]|nr:hypothetical protein [Bradyrhizobium sp. CCBAU 65884]
MKFRLGELSCIIKVTTLIAAVQQPNDGQISEANCHGRRRRCDAKQPLRLRLFFAVLILKDLDRAARQRFLLPF